MGVLSFRTPAALFWSSVFFSLKPRTFLLFNLLRSHLLLIIVATTLNKKGALSWSRSPLQESKTKLLPSLRARLFWHSTPPHFQGTSFYLDPAPPFFLY